MPQHGDCLGLILVDLCMSASSRVSMSRYAIRIGRRGAIGRRRHRVSDWTSHEAHAGVL